MKATFFIVALVLVIFGIFSILDKDNKNNNAPIVMKNTPIMQITSNAFINGESIPPKYTCDGEDINPELLLSGIPKGAQSLAIVLDDPDSPIGTWLHWTIWNLSPDTHILPEGYRLADETEGITSFGNIGYGGPCPGSGEHRYFFKLFALDTKLNLPSDTDRKELEGAMEGHVIDSAELMGLYSRN